MATTHLSMKASRARRGLEQQDHREDAVAERDHVDHHAPLAQVPVAGRAPALQALAQRGQHHGLERDVDAQHRERRHPRQLVGKRVDVEADQDRDDAGDHQCVRRNRVPLRHFRQPATAGQHAVAGERVQQPAARRLQRQHTGDEGGDRHAQEYLGTDCAQRTLEDARDRVGVVAVDDVLQVRRRQHVADVGHQARDAADDDRQHHRQRDPPCRVVHLLGDVTARLEPVEQEQARQRGAQKGDDVGRRPAGAHGVEEHRERIRPLEDQQKQAEGDDADELGRESDPGHPRQHVGTAEVDQQRETNSATAVSNSTSLDRSTPNNAATNPPPNSATAVTVTITAHR